MSFQTCMTVLFLWNTDYIRKSVGNQTVSHPIDFHCMVKNIMQVNGIQNCLVTNILQNIFFCVPQNKETNTGLNNMRVSDDIESLSVTKYA